MNESTIAIAIESPCERWADEADLRELVLHTLALEGVHEPVTLTIVLVDDATIHELNRRFLDHDEPTDVITFALDGDDLAGDFVLPEDAVPRQLGEIYISCERAAAQSAEWSTAPDREVRFLAIHGVLHLLGWDDATPEERTRMLARQETILDARPASGTVAR